jgi:hypothetical protein
LAFRGVRQKLISSGGPDGPVNGHALSLLKSFNIAVDGVAVFTVDFERRHIRQPGKLASADGSVERLLNTLNPGGVIRWSWTDVVDAGVGDGSADESDRRQNRCCGDDYNSPCDQTYCRYEHACCSCDIRGA